MLQARALDRVARHRDHTRLLLVQRAIRARIDDAGDLALGVMLDLDHLAVRPHFETAGVLALGNLSIERGPLGA